MIRYDLGGLSLRDRVATREKTKTWLDRAERRTKTLVKKKKFEEKTSIWSEVKPIFIELQRNKCVFCEKVLESGVAPIEHDLEHFRPKSTVRAWPGSHRPELSYGFATGAAWSSGYYWLAYDLKNYAAACKTCNSPLKASFFPIGGKRGKHGATPESLAGEKPFLCCPLGDIDDDPETLITFVATTAIPLETSGHRHRRGRIIIDFFKLNVREELHLERAQMLLLLGNALRDLDRSAISDAEKELSEQLVQTMVAGNRPHTACCRAFRRLWVSDQDQGHRILDLCARYYSSGQGIPRP